MYRKTGFGAVLLTVVSAFVLVTPPATAAGPSPVYAPEGSVADPGVLRVNGEFYVFSTAGNGRVSRGDTANGPWRQVGPAVDLSDPPSWVDTGQAVWAPDAWRTSAGWVLYYSAAARGFGGQRCIGAATSDQAGGPYTPVGDTPLVCPGGRHDGEDTVPGRPVAGAGVIDPSPFVDGEGRRFLLYKTQQTPSSLRMLRLGDGGLHWTGNPSGELLRRDGIVENPVMVQRGSEYVLFASRYGYHNCSYATVWLRSRDKWDFAGATEHALTTTAGTGICGPGGADVTPSLDGGWRIFLHGWVCGAGTAPCTTAQIENGADRRRALYAAILHWGSGATPSVGAFF
ncbi:glycoside hydrolase family 43 protein [Saccharothrix sp. BKS2]|uniref:glycoside hydrolase family 43 protein n=1 Tax=Saccharothrix sp. BKS2 TaxID=3064400 RepID=UPI0039EB5544